MKKILRDAGVFCARSLGSGDSDQIKQFATDVCYPLIIKPRDGAGASGTFKVTDDNELNAALHQSNVGRGGEVAAEEFIEGHEGFYDTITVNGKVVFEFVTHYYPNVLEAMRHRWISPQFITSNRIDSVDEYVQNMMDRYPAIAASKKFKIDMGMGHRFPFAQRRNSHTRR